MRPHCSDKTSRAPGQFRFGECPVDQAFRLTAKKCDTLVQPGFEIQLATHGTFGNGDDGIGKTGDARHVIKRLACDDGAVQIGDQKLFPAICRWEYVDIHAASRCLLPQTIEMPGRVLADRHFQCHAGMEPSGGVRVGGNAAAAENGQDFVNGEIVSLGT